MPKAVIVPIEGDAPSERALAPATALAWRAHADLILVHVAPGREQAVERDGEFKAALAGSGLSGEVVIRWRADPARVIREVADVSGPDAVICMATRAPGRLGGVVLGSTAEAVTREATCPLLLVGPHVLPQRGWPWQELAVCVDGSPASEALLPVAAEWADEPGNDEGSARLLPPSPLPRRQLRSERRGRSRFDLGHGHRRGDPLRRPTGADDHLVPRESPHDAAVPRHSRAGRAPPRRARKCCYRRRARQPQPGRGRRGFRRLVRAAHRPPSVT